MTYKRPSDFGSPSRGVAADVEEGLDVTVAKLQELLTSLREGARVVSCPSTPVMIPGIGAGSAYVAGDCMGTVFSLRVPKNGILYSATFYDLDDEGTQVDFELFTHSIADAGDNAAFAPTDQEILYFVEEIRFFAFDDHGANQTSTVENLGKAYTAPEGLFYIQSVTRSTPTIAAGNMPRVQIQILSGDPDFRES